MRIGRSKLSGTLANIFSSALLVGFACSGALAQQAAPQKLPAIVVTEVVTRPMTDRVLATGTLKAVEEVYVQPLIDALSVKTLKADVGDRVKAGDVLAELNGDALVLQRSQYLATKAKSEAALAQYRAQVIQAQANADNAVRQRDRQIQLGRSGTVSTSQVESQTSSADAALAQLNAARQAVSVGEADIKVVEAQIADTELKLSRTQVKAPVDGVISARNAKVGAIATNASSPLFTMIRDGAIELVADVPENQIRKIEVGMPAEITVSGSNTPIKGKVRLISPTVDATTRLGLVYVLLDGNSGAKAGMYGSARIIVKQDNVLALPQSAVTTNKKGSIARRVDNNTVQQVAVETGIQDNGYVQIVTGLQAGDVVVAKAGAFVRDGDRISPVPAEPAAGN
ncbi:efflux RND transporter periplasmic adaptor subunit [Rhizobium oryzicola]|uniref:Efflux RND transporter periplasmic adaptor subunit n=1 Tax=Rhizobium oryzicola TaxID=1232668 RepID=A0ABT8SUS9_9HYPH|nr:efflux RND transporter periplasmic adaptor subunit [Rhizobium oryzicola]MDO1582178.1 efflux RND transporter periplasmic adaptor subunit [Rhizobium oryzicola]